MSRYIRTKDGIYKLIEIRKNEYRMLNADGTVHLAHYESEDYKIADTIEELCDEYVIVDKRNNVHYLMIYEDVIDEINNGRIYDEDVIYGAIWIEIKLPNGKSVFRLEPVAIMNEDGVLCLL